MDVILVGDSLGMVVQGTRKHASGHGQRHGLSHRERDACQHQAMVIADMPFMSHGTPQQALDTAGPPDEGRWCAHGQDRRRCAAGGDRASSHGACGPVCGHLGLMPQSIHQLGAYRVQGRGEHEGERILKDAVAFAACRCPDAGAGVRACRARRPR